MRARRAAGMLLPMERVGPYELVELVGRGAIGQVYRARCRETGREVAVKVLRAELRDDPRRRRIVVNEAMAAARIRHPNVVALLDAGLDRDGAPFLVHELVGGPQLLRFVTEWPGLDAARRLVRGLLDGLTEAHAAGVVHRDLKPENVLVELPAPEEPIAKIADFGLARFLGPGPEGAAPREAGTRAYMAPEQRSPSAPVGPWTDLFALGVILDELFSGRAIDGTGARAPFRPRRGLRVPDELERLVGALTAPEPRARPRFARDVRDALEAILDRCVEVAVPLRAHSAPTRVGAETVTVPPSFSDVFPGPPAARVDAVPTSARSLLSADEADAPPPPGLERQLAHVIDRTCADRRSRVMLLMGPPRAGKSRLARWGLAEVERRARMEGLCAGYDAAAGDVSGGLRRELARVLGVPAKSPERRPPELSWLGAGDAELSALGRFLRAEVPDPPAARVAQMLHETLAAMSRVRPVYLWLDDVDQAEDGALELVERIAAHPSAAAIVVVATVRAPARLERIEALARRRAVRRVHLEATSRAARAPEARLEDTLAAMGAERPDAERILAAASLLGVRFDDAALRAARAGDPSLDRVIDVALFAGILGVDRVGAYRFEHPVVREALARLTRARPDHGEIAAGVAEALFATYGSERSDVAARAAVLFREGGAHDRAWDALLHAATVLARGGDHEGAAARLRTARAWLRTDRTSDALRARVLFTEADAAYFALRYDEARRLLGRVRRLARSLGDGALATRCLCLEANVRFYLGELDRSEALARACLGDISERGGRAPARDRDHAILGFIVWHRLAEIASIRGDLDGAARSLAESRAHAVETGAGWRVQVADINLVELDLARGRLDAARARSERLLREARASGDAHLLGEIVDTEARVALFSGDAARAHELLAARAPAIALVGDRWRTTALRVLLALEAAHLGDDAATRDAVRALAAAFGETPIDDPFTVAALRRLHGALVDRGLDRAARRVRGIERARARRFGQRESETS